MAAQPRRDLGRALQVHRGSGGEGAQVGAVQGLLHDVGAESAAVQFGAGQAHPVDRDGVAG